MASLFCEKLRQRNLFMICVVCFFNTKCVILYLCVYIWKFPEMEETVKSLSAVSGVMYNRSKWRNERKRNDHIWEDGSTP